MGSHDFSPGIFCSDFGKSPKRELILFLLLPGGGLSDLIKFDFLNLAWWSICPNIYFVDRVHCTVLDHKGKVDQITISCQ